MQILDNYQIKHIFDYEDITYYDFFGLITPNIIVYILKTLPNDKNPIKYTFVIHNENDKQSYSYIKNIKTFSPDLEIYLPKTIGISRDSLIYEINRAIDAKNFTDYDWLNKEDNNDTLTIIQERLTIPRYYREPNESQTKLSKTFIEDTCIVCIDNKPNILYCNCGHLVACEECFDKLDNKTNCLKCRQKNNIVRKI